MKLSADNLKLRERFLTPDFASRLGKEKEGVDPFTTGTEELPKAFRDGECTEISSDRADFNMLLFWKNDDRSEQRPIKIEVAKVGDKWLIDKVTR